MVEIEVQAIKDSTRRRRVLQLASECTIELTEPVLGRASELSRLGIGAADAVHVAAAEAQQVDILLTCDDRLVRLANRLDAALKVRVANPVQWLKEQQDATNLG